MGVDYYWLSKDIEEENGRLAQRVLSDIIDIIEDDKPFKEQRIEKKVELYKERRQSI